MPFYTLSIVILVAFLIGIVAKGKARSLGLLVASILAIYWLQPATPIRHLDFWLPTIIIVLSIFTYKLTKPKDTPSFYYDLKTGLVIVFVILIIGVARYLGPFCCLTPTRPPAIEEIFVVLVAFSLIIFLFQRYATSRNVWIYLSISLTIGLFIILKSDNLAKIVSICVRHLNSQAVELAASSDIKWLGFSYVAFRLLHTLFDRLSGRLPDLRLSEFVTYIIFFPAYSAGPIDRVQRFVQDLRQPFTPNLDSSLMGGKRFLLGIFKKFVLADSLALFALNNINSGQVKAAGWLWIMLYAYAFRILFDFSGYTDIAIGLGQLLGIHLPENFDQPYIKHNLTAFWNSWHITLAQWFRAYFFNPLTRALRSSSLNIPLPLIIFVGQFTTFVLIGLWHGISWNFAIWGTWHGLGLFIHNRWSYFIRSRFTSLENHSWINRAVSSAGVVITFNYVCLGWVWFAIASPIESWRTLLKLFGLA